MDFGIEKGKIAVLIGTRPEGMKLCPLVLEMRRLQIAHAVISTGQHSDMLRNVLSAFHIEPDLSLSPMRFGENLPAMLSHLIASLGSLFRETSPPLVIVQGDTATVYAGALAAFLQKIPVLHVEAGLRSGDIFSPFPEESFRRSIAAMASVHIAPTPQAMYHLWQEGVAKERVFLFGNTVQDALFRFLPQEIEQGNTLLLTVHRREHSENELRGIFSAVRKLMEESPGYSLAYPVHPSPRVRKIAEEMLSAVPRISLLPPLPPQEFYRYLAASPLVLTDSGGIQEEAAILGIKTLVLREKTEREQELSEGRICLSGTDPDRIFRMAKELLSEPKKKHSVRQFSSPSAKICKLLLAFKEFDFDMQRLFREF